MKRTPKIALAAVVFAGCIGSGVAANASSPAPAPASVQQVATFDAAATYNRLHGATKAEKTKILSSLTQAQLEALFAKYPVTYGKVTEGKTKAVSTKSAVAEGFVAAGRHPKGCWYKDFNVELLEFGDNIGRIWTGATWCSTGTSLGSKWRKTGGYVTALQHKYVGYKKMVNAEQKKKNIYMVAVHEVEYGYGPVHITLHACQKMRLKHAGHWAYSNSCNPY